VCWDFDRNCVLEKALIGLVEDIVVEEFEGLLLWYCGELLQGLLWIVGRRDFWILLRILLDFAGRRVCGLLLLLLLLAEDIWSLLLLFLPSSGVLPVWNRVWVDEEGGRVDPAPCYIFNPSCVLRRHPPAPNYQQLPLAEKKDFSKIKQTLRTAFAADSFLAYERFIVRKLQPGETVDVFLAELRKLAASLGGLPATYTSIPDSWKLEAGILSPVFGTTAVAPSSILQIVACSCKSQPPCSTNRWSCRSARLSCTTYCSCSVDEVCSNNIPFPRILFLQHQMKTMMSSSNCWVTFWLCSLCTASLLH